MHQLTANHRPGGVTVTGWPEESQLMTPDDILRFFWRYLAGCRAVKSRLSGVPIRTNSHRLVQKLVQDQRSDS